MQGKNSEKSGERRTQAERRAETRKALLDAARALIVEKGYAETGTPEIVKAADVTRGALYHHFADKADLMRALVHQESEAIATEINSQTNTGQTPLDAFMSGAAPISRPCPLRPRKDHAAGRTDGARAVGNGGDRSPDRRCHASGRPAACSQSRCTEDIPLEPLADLLSSAFDRAALAIANGGDRKAYEAATRKLLAGILAD